MKTHNQLKNEYFVFVDNEFFDKDYQTKYGIESILVLALIQKNLLVRNNKYIFNLQFLFTELNIKQNNSIQQKKIRNCLIQLQNDNVIISDDDMSKINNTQLVHVDISIPDNNYTIVYDYELNKIINYKQENLYNLFNLFVFLKYRIGDKGYCYWNQADIAYSIGLKSRKVISRMIKVLATELELILVDNIGTKKFNDGSIKESNNMYAMNYEGAEELLKQKKEEYKYRLKEHGVKIIKNKTANDKRKYARLINHRRIKYYKGIITDKELKELKQYEKIYYDMIKNDKDTLEEKRDDFITL